MILKDLFKNIQKVAVTLAMILKLNIQKIQKTKKITICLLKNDSIFYANYSSKILDKYLLVIDDDR